MQIINLYQRKKEEEEEEEEEEPLKKFPHYHSEVSYFYLYLLKYP